MMLSKINNKATTNVYCTNCKRKLQKMDEMKREASICCRWQRWAHPTSREAMIVSWVSVLVTITTATVGIVLGAKDESPILLAYGLEAALDLVSSFAVLWRFWNKSKVGREKRASAIIGFSFVASGSVICVDSFVHLAKEHGPRDGKWEIVLAIVSIIVLGLLGFLKIYIGRALRSDALFEDGVSSFGSVSLSISVLVSIVVFQDHPNAWWIDSAFGVVVGLFFLLYGVFIVRKFPEIFKPGFWHGETEGSPATSSVSSESDDIDLNPLEVQDIEMV